MVFESTKDKTNNISKLYEALKSVEQQKYIIKKKVAHIIHMNSVKIVDWSMLKSFWTGGENIQIFHDFD